VGNDHLAERVSTIDEQASTWNERESQSLKRERSSVGVTAVEGTDPHGEREVVALVVRIQLELLGGDLASGEPSGRDQLPGELGELGDRLGGPVNCEHVPGGLHAVGDLAGGSTGTATYLDHAKTWSERQGIDDRSEPWRQRSHPCPP
jgi:hypothetical protein